MVKFVETSPEELENLKPGRRGRVSYPIIKAFMETKYYVGMVDLTDSKRKAPHMYALLKSYCVNNDMPVKPMMRSGRLYLMRLDIDEKGKEIKDWRAKLDPVADEAWTATEGPLLDDKAVDNA